MDTKQGFCWKCNSKLQSSFVKCASCGIAEYCSSACTKQDEIRHGSIECPTWSPKICGTCKRKGAKSECTGCNSVWYCNKQCQRGDWKTHKVVCKEWQHRVFKVFRRNKPALCEYPYYFGSSFPNDLLNLSNNELLQDAEKYAGANFKIFLPACGDLRQVMQTVHSLPDAFKGSLKFTLNDIDPFVIARNVLLLYMVATCEQGKACNVSTIWLSWQLPDDDYFLLQEKLKKLIEMDSKRLKETTGGLIEVSKKEYNSLREVWKKWIHLSCKIGNQTCSMFQEQRRATFSRSQKERDTLGALPGGAPHRHSESIRKWFDDGVIVPSRYSKMKLTYLNPTFTGRTNVFAQEIQDKSPSSYEFVYCVIWNCLPYQIWDYLEMVEFHSSDSVTEMCNEFTTHLVSKSITMMNQKRLSFNIWCEDFAHLSSMMISKSDHCKAYDRISASNLIDYHDIATVIQLLEPFLSETNPFAVLLTETFNWHWGLEGAKLLPSSLNKISLPALLSIKNYRTSSHLAEFYDNTLYFLAYLRGIRVDADGILHNRPPTLSEVSKCHGLTMRNFRRRRNRIVPFINRVHARPVNVVTGLVRTLEWFRETPDMES